MLRIKNIDIQTPIVVAPMAGISNDAFRQLCFEFGAGLVYTEMVSDKAIYYHNQRTLEMLKTDDAYHPVSMQIFGSDPLSMVYAAKVLDQETNCDIIDINMGCPVSKVVKTGAGSAMMLKEDETVATVEKIIQNVNKPVTVKMRLGYDLKHMNYLSLARKLENAGVSAIALHARTRSQMYEGHSDWEHIRLLKENLSIPVIGNGDVKTVEDYIRMKGETGCDAVMIGRGLVGNPFLIKEISKYLENKETVSISNDDKLNYCLIHARKLIDLKGEKIGMSEMRGLAPHYLTGMYHSASYRSEMNQMNNFEDLKTIIEEYRQFLRDNEKEC